MADRDLDAERAVLVAARAAYAVGLCPLPVTADGSKRPDVQTWKAFQTRRPTPDEFWAWDWPTSEGLGIIAGPVSGHRESWDFDAADAFDAFIAAAAATGLGAVVQRIRDGYEDQTPGGGRRWIVTYPATVAWKDRTLARRPGRDGEPDVKTLIEQPTFAIVAPSNGCTHPSGRAYVRITGGFDTIASYTTDERAALLALARSFDEMPKARAAEDPPRRTTTASGGRPGDDFIARTAWPEVLERAGWARVYERGGTTYWRRPGKAVGISATTNHAGSDLFYPFTSSSAFDSERSYSKFGAYAVLHHGGDFARAASALAREGYGTHAADDPAPVIDAPATARPAVALECGDALLAPLPDMPYSGWFNRGALHVIGGSSGAGKTTLIIDLLRRQRRGESVLGHAGQRHDYLVVFADRGKVSNRETFERMGIDPATLSVALIEGVPHGATSSARIHAAIDACGEVPAAVFIEGADMLVVDPSKPAVVTEFMAHLLRIAEHYGIAMILSVGAGKAKPKEGYVLKRDQLFGSIMWARRADTVLVLTIEGDGTTPRRHLAVLHRNAPAEAFDLEFQDGLLVPAAVVATATEQDLVAWFRQAEVFTARRFRAAFPRFSGSRAHALLDGYVKLRVLRAKTKNDRTHYVYPSGTDPALSRQRRDDSAAAERPEGTVPQTSGMGRANDDAMRENLRDSASAHTHSLIPPETCPTSHSSLLDEGEWDKDMRPTVDPRAREAEDVPAWTEADDERL